MLGIETTGVVARQALATSKLPPRFVPVIPLPSPRSVRLPDRCSSLYQLLFSQVPSKGMTAQPAEPPCTRPVRTMV